MGVEADVFVTALALAAAVSVKGVAAGMSEETATETLEEDTARVLEGAGTPVEPP